MEISVPGEMTPVQLGLGQSSHLPCGPIVECLGGGFNLEHDCPNCQRPNCRLFWGDNCQLSEAQFALHRKYHIFQNENLISIIFLFLGQILRSDISSNMSEMSGGALHSASYYILLRIDSISIYFSLKPCVLANRQTNRKTYSTSGWTK